MEKYYPRRKRLRKKSPAAHAAKDDLINFSVIPSASGSRGRKPYLRVTDQIKPNYK